ncbi:MAG: hypothetical protein PF444_01195 [Bacteroidales bacterium]|jgi:hypothetical protein|nr:hypothetical protein [Bacteroidales bacterium]
MNNKLVKLKNWQILLVLVGIILGVNSMINWSNSPILLSSKPLVLLISSTLLILSYWWNISASLSKVNNEVISMKKLRINLTFYVSIVIAIFIMLSRFTNLFGGIGIIGDENGVNAVFISQKALTYTIPLCLLLFLFVLISAAITAKQLKSNEEKRKVKISEYLNDVILVLLFPIGVWSIQKRLNHLFSTNKELL